MMMNQLPDASFAPKNVRRALIESDHRTLRRTQLAGLDADRIAHVLPNDDRHVPLRDIAARIEAGHVQKTRVYLVPSHCMAASRAEIGDVGAMGPYGGQRREVAVQGAVESGIEKQRRAADFIFSRRRSCGSMRLRSRCLRKWRREVERRGYGYHEKQISPVG